MKKLLLITLAAFVMTNCAKESIVDSDLDKIGNRIAFSSYSTITRGNSVNGNSEFMASGNIFGVTAFSSANSEAPYMGTVTAGVPIVSNGTAWSYQNDGDSRFWPTDGRTMLNFFAYAPFTDANRTATPALGKTTGLVFTDYTVSTTATEQNDFMYASALSQSKQTSGTAVNLTFRHAMTQILFKARVKTDKGLYVDIEENGISLHNINSKGTFTLSNANVASWSAATEPTNYTVPSAAVNEMTGTEEGDVKNIFIADNVLMLLPQEFAAWDKIAVQNDPSTQARGYLSLKCKLYYKDGNGVKQYLKGSNDDFATINIPFSSQDGDGAQIWKMQNKITYILLIDGTMAGLDPITFTTNVEDWNPVTDGGIVL